MLDRLTVPPVWLLWVSRLGWPFVLFLSYLTKLPSRLQLPAVPATSFWFVVFAIAPFVVFQVLLGQRLAAEAVAEGRAKKILGQVDNFTAMREIYRAALNGNRWAKLSIWSELAFMPLFFLFLIWPKS